MKKKLAKIAALSMAAVSLVLVTVLATVAFLTSRTSVTNSFTVGNVGIEMYESYVVNGVKQADDPNVNGDKKDASANSYRLIPGKTYDKDPTIYLEEDSEESYLFVKIDNGIVDIEAKGDTEISAQMSEKGWVLLPGSTNVYYYADDEGNPVKKCSGSVDVFSTFTIADNADVSQYKGKKIDLTAYAIQAEGFAASAQGAADAWDALEQEYNNN